MPSQFVKALPFSLVKLVFQVLGIPILEREVNVLQAVREVGQVVERSRPGTKSVDPLSTNQNPDKNPKSSQISSFLQLDLE